MLHRVVRDHLESLLADCAARSATGRGYPAHVQAEFRRYLDCGILANGFLRVHCDACKQDELLAFSCKGRSLCPSCIGRRMSELSSRLVDERLPYAPYRQWTFSFPWRLRVALARDGRLLAKVLSICKRKVFANQRKRARRLGIRDGRCLAVTLVQRFGSLLQLNVHDHSVIPDGVFADDADGRFAFFELPPPTDADVESIARGIARAVEKTLANAEPADDEHEHLAAAVAANAASAGTRSGREPSELARTRTPRTAVVQSELGTFSVHANTAVDENDRAGLERLLRYASRPPLAQRRLSLDAAGRVRYRLRRPYYTGQTELVLEPVDFLRKLAALVPPPRQNQIRFYGLLAPQAHDRERFEQLMPVPPGPTDELADDRAADPHGTGAATATATEPQASAHRAASRQRWATLLKRVFQTDALVCPTCQGPRRILAAITERDPIHQILTGLGLSTDVPVIAKARPPPQTDFAFDEPC